MQQAKRHILLVDDDAIILRIYQDGLRSKGFKVSTAVDGVAAMRALKQERPDLMVLDLMMPKLSGVDVLRFLRSDSSLASLPVIVLSNAFMNEVAVQAVNLGVQKALLKVRCRPEMLACLIEDVLEGRETPEDLSQLLVTPKAPAPSARGSGTGMMGVRVPTPETCSPSAGLSSQPTLPQGLQATKKIPGGETELRAKARHDFLVHGPETCAALRAVFDSLAAAGSELELSVRLNNLFRKVHLLVATAALADCPEISHLASVFEALLYDLLTKPSALNASVLRTCNQALQVFPVLFHRAADSLAPLYSKANVLAVDDDPVCNRLVVAALLHAQLQAVSLEDPHHVLPALKEEKFDLILLDIEMPDISGFDLCRLIRRLPGYEKTPVIFVTRHDDFANRESGIASGGDDLISKPILPLELAVKVVTYSLQRQA